MIKPPKIYPNDKIIIVSPAGLIDKKIVYNTSNELSKWNLKVEIAPNALGKSGRFSGTVEQRLSDLQTAMDNPEAKIILCSRGGYGMVHLLKNLNFEKIKQTPKWIIGYSDITLLHSALQKNGIMSMHAPMAKHIAEEGIEDKCVVAIRNILEGNDLIYNFSTNGYKHLNKCGETSGELFGGNLAVFCSLLGTEFAHIPQNGILFIEDIGEEPYKIDRFLHQIKLSGIFDNINGLIVGQFTDYKEDANMYHNLYESIDAITKEYKFPICYNFPVGHVKHNLPLIMGKKTKLKVDKEKIIFTQI